MKSLGTVRKLDDLGRVTMPISARKMVGIENSSLVEFLTDGDSIVVRKFDIGCLVCGNPDESKLKNIDNVTLCSACAKKFL